MAKIMKPESLADEQLLEAYRYYSKVYNMDDAETYMRNALDRKHFAHEEINDKIREMDENGVFELLSERFEGGHDSMISDDDQWKGIVEDYLEENPEILKAV